MPQGAEQDLHQLNRAYRPALMAFFLRRLRNHAEAEDLTQDVFLRLARSDWGEVRSAEAYIFGIAANLLRDRARKEKHRFDYRALLASEEALGIDDLDPSRILSGQQALSTLGAALRELPEVTRAAFVLHRLESVSRREIAAAYRISEAAVDRHLAKAMVHLISRLREVRP